jgi:hypothetical protein
VSGEVKQRTLCANGHPLDESPNLSAAERTPCPTCGTLGRRFEVDVSATVEVHSSLDMKAKTPGKRRPFVEQRQGASFSYARKKWIQFVRIIDRRGNRYVERVHDPETDEVLRDADEPLSGHQGHGSARK